MEWISVKIREDDFELIDALAENMDADEAEVLHEIIKFYFDCRKAVADGFDRHVSMEFVED